MTQIKTFRSEFEVNDWLQENQDKQIIDIKFCYSGTSSWMHEKYMIIYQEKADPNLSQIFDSFFNTPLCVRKEIMDNV